MMMSQACYHVACSRVKFISEHFDGFKLTNASKCVEVLRLSLNGLPLISCMADVTNGLPL